jgi:signal transduction histidine kinase
MGHIRQYDGEYLRAVAHFNESIEDIAAIQATPKQLSPENWSGRALLERRPIHILDGQVEPGDHPLAQRNNLRTYLAVPLLREGAPLGSITIWRNFVQPFSERQIELVKTFADQAVIAIENVRLFREIEQKSRELEVASHHKSQFVASMSHEFRTPLNAIIGFSEVLLDSSLKVTDEERNQFLTDILQSGKHLLGLINDILDLSKIEAGRMELQIEPASLPNTLEVVQSTLRPLAAKKSIDFRVESDGQLASIPMDAARIKQVLLNLVGNAIKFTPEGGRVWLRADVENGEVRIEVGDTGPGIPPEEQERIFLEFQQARTVTGDKPEGTGLGLALARRFVELHRGKIWVESEVGKGSLFFFTLPIQ